MSRKLGYSNSLTIQFVAYCRKTDVDVFDHAQDGWSAVHLAAMYSREEAIRALVHRKSDINAQGGVSAGEGGGQG